MADEPTPPDASTDAPKADADDKKSRPNRKKRKGPRWPRWLLNALVVLLGLITLAAWAPFLVPSSVVTRHARTLLTHRLGVPVALDRASLRGWFVLDIENLRIGETPMIDLGEARLHLSPRLLVSDTVHVKRITVQDLTLHARTLEDGRLNFERLWLRRRTPDAPPPKGNKRLKIGDIHARRVRLLLADVTGGRPIRLEGDLDAAWDEAQNCHNVDVLGEFILNADRLFLRARTQLGVFNPKAVTGRVHLLSLSNGSLSLGPPSLQNRLDISDLDAAFTRDRFGMRAEARFALGDAPVRLSLGRNIHGEARTNLCLVNGGRVDATGLARTVADFANLPAAPAENRGQKVPMAFLRGLDARAELTFDSLSARGHTFRNVHWSLKAREGVVQVDSGPMAYNDGTLTATVTVDATGRLPQWSAEVTGVEVQPRRNMDPIINALMAVVVLQDPVDLKGNFSGVGVGRDALFRTLDGAVTLDTGKGYAKIPRPPGYITTVFLSLDTEQLHFESGRGSWTFKGSVVKVDLRFKTGIAKAVDSFAKGQVDLKKRKQNLLFGVDMESSLGVRLRDDSTLGGKTDITLATLEGTFDEPVALKWYELQARTVAQVIKSIIIDDPIVLFSPNMSVREKATHFRDRLQGLLGMGIKPFLFASDSAKWLLDGVHGTMRNTLLWVIGEDDNGDKKK